MEKYYLAIDIGASSGRHMLASVADGKMQLEEIYRFPNGMDNVNGTVSPKIRSSLSSKT